MEKILIVKRKEVKIQVIIKENQISEFILLLVPFFSIEYINTLSSDIWSIYSSPKDEYDLTNFTIYNEPSPDGPGTNIYMDKDKKIIMVNQSDYKWEILYLVRMVRNIMRWLLWSEHIVYMHGGLVKIKDYGIAIIGEKKAGKTSTILSIIGKCSASNFITNDDLSLEVGENNIVGFGWPRALCIRYDTICQLKKINPAFFEKIGKLNHPSNKYMINYSNIKISDHYYFFPNEIADCSNTKLLSQTNIDYIIFPSFIGKEGNNAYIERLGYEEAYKRLLSNVNDLPESYCGFLTNSFNNRIVRDESILLRDIALKVPCYILYQTFDGISKGASIIEKLIEEG